jgi:hypothetical protein
MEKKINLFDVIIFNGDLKFLKLRIVEFYDVVDYFIIVPNSESSKIIFENESEFIFSHKEKIIISEIYEDDSKLQNTIKEILKKKYLSFDDLIFLSQENEIPNYRDLDSVIEELKYNSIFLNHKTFFWNVDFVHTELFCGSFVFKFTTLLTNSNLILNMVHKKESNWEKITNGWKFEGFHEINENEFFYRENLLPSTDYNPATTYQLLKRDFEIPENFNILGYNKIGRDYMKKHLFLVESDKNVNLNDIKKLYDSVSIITFSDNVNEIIAENIGDEVYKNVLYLPDRKLYGELGLKEFQDEYKKNEIKKIIHTVSPLDQDLIRIIYKDFNDIEKPWEQLKNENISEIINPS